MFVCIALISAVPLNDSSTEYDDDLVDDDLDLDTRTGCAFECEKGTPVQNPDYRPSHNGCGSYGVNVDLKTCPYLTVCCNRHDFCYGRCGTDRDLCDSWFKTCTQNPPASYNGLRKGLCKSVGNGMYYAVRALGCRAFKNAQKKSCICK